MTDVNGDEWKETTEDKEGKSSSLLSSLSEWIEDIQTDIQDTITGSTKQELCEYRDCLTNAKAVIGSLKKWFPGHYRR